MTAQNNRDITIVFKLIARILYPIRIEVHHRLLYREDTMTLVETCVGEVSIVGEELILVVSETDHVVTAPVLVEELTSALVVNLIERRLGRNCGSAGIGANLVEEILGYVKVLA